MSHTYVYTHTVTEMLGVAPAARSTRRQWFRECLCSYGSPCVRARARCPLGALGRLLEPGGVLLNSTEPVLLREHECGVAADGLLVRLRSGPNKLLHAVELAVARGHVQWRLLPLRDSVRVHARLEQRLNSRRIA